MVFLFPHETMHSYSVFIFFEKLNYLNESLMGTAVSHACSLCGFQGVLNLVLCLPSLYCLMQCRVGLLLRMSEPSSDLLLADVAG